MSVQFPSTQLEKIDSKVFDWAGKTQNIRAYASLSLEYETMLHVVGSGMLIDIMSNIVHSTDAGGGTYYYLYIEVDGDVKLDNHVAVLKPYKTISMSNLFLFKFNSSLIIKAKSNSSYLSQESVIKYLLD